MTPTATMDATTTNSVTVYSTSVSPGGVMKSGTWCVGAGCPEAVRDAPLPAGGAHQESILISPHNDANGVDLKQAAESTTRTSATASRLAAASWVLISITPDQICQP